MNQPLHKELSMKVLGMAFKVHNALGPGLLEHCYEEAFCVELKYAGIPTCMDALVSRGAWMRGSKFIRIWEIDN